ncbi:MAG: ATP synthase F1 subunit gamma [Firmicutes bacterium]|nr:ATP synthase F1 subunit gamma [Bacillota bacterium]
MSNARDIKRRIKSVTSTQQITKAMKMVSAAKLRRAQAAVQSVRPFTAKIEAIISELSGASDHAFLRERAEVNKVCYLVIGSDRGLCGGFNGNLNRYLDSVLKDETHEYELVVVGRKLGEHCRRMKYPVYKEYFSVGDNPAYHKAADIGNELSRAFMRGDFDEVKIVYSEFKSAMSQSPKCRHLLPIEKKEVPAEEQEAAGVKAQYIFEPDAESILDVILPQYVEIDVYDSLQNAKASEHGARMTSMSSATDNANEMISKLTLSLNRARQAAITTEISEIVGGAAALN